MATPKKIKLSDKAKKRIKDNFLNFTSKDVSRLSPEGKRYHQIVRAANSKKIQESYPDHVTIDGKKYKGKVIVQLVADTAREKSLTINQVVKKGKKQLLKMIETGYDRKEYRPEKMIENIEKIRNRYVYINDGNGVVRYTKKEAIKQITLFQNFISNNSSIVEIGLPRKIWYGDGKFEIDIPDYEQYGDEDIGEDEIDDLLDTLDIFYIRSPKKKK